MKLDKVHYDLKCGSDAEKIAALQYIADMPTLESLNPLIAAMYDADQTIRGFAATILRDELKWMPSSNRQEKYQFYFACGRYKTLFYYGVSVVPFLLTKLDDGDEYTKSNIIRLIGALDERRAIGFITACLNDESKLVTNAAQRVLDLWNTRAKLTEHDAASLGFGEMDIDELRRRYEFVSRLSDIASDKKIGKAERLNAINKIAEITDNEAHLLGVIADCILENDLEIREAARHAFMKTEFANAFANFEHDFISETDTYKRLNYAASFFKSLQDSPSILNAEACLINNVYPEMNRQGIIP